MPFHSPAGVLRTKPYPLLEHRQCDADYLPLDLLPYNLTGEHPVFVLVTRGLVHPGLEHLTLHVFLATPHSIFMGKSNPFCFSLHWSQIMSRSFFMPQLAHVSVQQSLVLRSRKIAYVAGFQFHFCVVLNFVVAAFASAVCF